ncbi:hypothetical protein, partial [Paenibacillus sp. S150]|uniref:hypothetical protein n=1 Tax=Paenibacillus sp. S150 TaxID=2749826 RepID=UPI001C55C377
QPTDSSVPADDSHFVSMPKGLNPLGLRVKNRGIDKFVHSSGNSITNFAENHATAAFSGIFYT